MTEGASADSGQASRGASQTQDAGSGSDQQATTPSTSPAKTQDSQSAVKRRTLYDRLTHDIQHDHKVKQEVRMGKRIGFYKLKGQLGAGNFAKVKLGVHLLTTEKVAIKIIDKTKLDEHSRKLLSREIVCMEWLDHPNIIRLYEVIESFSTLHLVMECAGEGDLQAKIIKEGPLGEDQSRHFFAQITAAINHMHKKGVIHRDLKAENVFFVSDSQIKVGDFGFSTHSNGNMLDTFCGSPPYAAPELFADNSYQGELVDIWAMGVILYHMVSASMPFFGETIPQLREKILVGKYNMPSGITPVCQDLIRGLLTKNPEERFVMDDIFSSIWLRTTSTAIELHPSKNDIKTKTGARSNLPKLSRDNGVVDSSATGTSSALDVSFDAGTDPEILQNMEVIGLPTSDVNSLVGEPRNPIAGTYRILLHRKHLLELTGLQEEPSDTKERKKKVSTCSLAGQSVTDNSSQSGSTSIVHRQKQSKGKVNVVIKGNPLSKICAIL